jgi:hypothetical protein
MLSRQHRNLWHTQHPAREFRTSFLRSILQALPFEFAGIGRHRSGPRKICTKAADFASIGQIGALESAASGKNG